MKKTEKATGQERDMMRSVWQIHEKRESSPDVIRKRYFSRVECSLFNRELFCSTWLAFRANARRITRKSVRVFARSRFSGLCGAHCCRRESMNYNSYTLYTLSLSLMSREGWTRSDERHCSSSRTDRLIFIKSLSTWQKKKFLLDEYIVNEAVTSQINKEVWDK